MVPNSPALSFCRPHHCLWARAVCCVPSAQHSTATPFPFPSQVTFATLCESATLQSLRRPAGVSIPAQRFSRLRRVEQSSVVSCHLWYTVLLPSPEVLSTTICVPAAYPVFFASDPREGSSLGIGLEEASLHRRPGKKCVHSCSLRTRGTESPEAFLRAGDC